MVLPDGTVTQFGDALAETPELDLRGAFIGSEGTLGIATSITLRLLRAPECVNVLLADFATMEAAGEAVRAVTAAGLLPAGMEIMDNYTINAVDDFFGCDEYPRDAAAVLLIELDGQEAEVQASARRAEQLCRDAGARGLRRAEDPAECALLWKGRKSAFSAVGKITPTYYVQDGVVPALPRVLSAIERLSREHDLPVANVFHAGDGNLHPLILYRAEDPDVEARVKALGLPSFGNAWLWAAASAVSTASVPTSAVTSIGCSVRMISTRWRCCAGPLTPTIWRTPRKCFRHPAPVGSQPVVRCA